MDKLAVIVDNSLEEQLISRLLAGRNYRIFYRCEWLCKSNDKFTFIIIFHRRSQEAPIPCIPTPLSNSRIIVISDCKDENAIVKTLFAGAQYYFNIGDTERVLEARIHAALRDHSQHDRTILDIEPYTFHVGDRTVYYGNHRVDLTPREFQVAHYLFSNRGRIVSDSELMTRVWTLPQSLYTRRIDTSICRVRKKLNLNTTNSKWKIVRLRNEGYLVRSSSLSD